MEGISNKNLVPATKGTSVSETRRPFFQDWDEYFMTLAFLSAKLSTNPYVPIGVCIVNNKKEIVSTAYNGTLRDYADNKFYWYRGPRNNLSYEALYVPHAEMSALRNTSTNAVKNGTMYVTLFPCSVCAKKIIESGIKTVVYLQDKLNNYKSTSKMMFDAAGVAYRPKQIKINFSISDWDGTNQLAQTPMELEYLKEEFEEKNIINIHILLIFYLILIILDLSSMFNFIPVAFRYSFLILVFILSLFSIS